MRALWDGETLGARASRLALAPAELAFSVVAGIRGAMYDRRLLATHDTAVPALSVGNLTVGGTGKTPIAAWFARRLRDAGAAPAIVLRGYGEDEPLVHQTLNPDIPVIVSPDRLAGSAEAGHRGCDVVVLDDAFQHRRAARVADVVIVAADGWRESRHRLPVGPWREPLTAARRATLVLVSRKAASREQAEQVLSAVRASARVATSIVHLDAGTLSPVSGGPPESMDLLAGASVLAVSGIGDPEAFHAQLRARGATVVPASYGDHHRYTPEDVAALLHAGASHDRVVCTLKDAVKLGPLWPGSTPLWYVSQRVTIECGLGHVDEVVSMMMAARSTSLRSGRPGVPGSPD